MAFTKISALLRQRPARKAKLWKSPAIESELVNEVAVNHYPKSSFFVRCRPSYKAVNFPENSTSCVEVAASSTKAIYFIRSGQPLFKKRNCTIQVGHE